jgi:hypothetical protein
MLIAFVSFSSSGSLKMRLCTGPYSGLYTGMLSIWKQQQQAYHERLFLMPVSHIRTHHMY